MQTLSGSIAALAVATIYYTWRAYLHDRARHNHSLRERVTYMLWVMANQAR